MAVTKRVQTLSPIVRDDVSLLGLQNQTGHMRPQDNTNPKIGYEILDLP